MENEHRITKDKYGSSLYAKYMNDKGYDDKGSDKRQRNKKKIKVIRVVRIR